MSKRKRKRSRKQSQSADGDKAVVVHIGADHLLSLLQGDEVRRTKGGMRFVLALDLDEDDDDETLSSCRDVLDEMLEGEDFDGGEEEEEEEDDIEDPEDYEDEFDEEELEGEV